MSEDIIMSIKPQWFDLIASGQKTVEVRTTQPSHGYNWLWFYVSGTGKVLGKAPSSFIMSFSPFDEGIAKSACLSLQQLGDYAKGREHLYAWLITNFKPVSFPLSDFGLKRPPMSWQYVRSIGGGHMKESEK